MTSYLTLPEATTQGGKIVPFPGASTASIPDSSLNVDYLLKQAFSDPDIESRLKGVVEGAIMDAVLKSQLADFTRIDDPFDAVYISELKADSIKIDDVEGIAQYSEVVDVSDTIIFDDEWDD